eukprot:SAG25_NODE_4018_length_907_cov_1.226485_1_plen_104_part_00
MQLGPRLQLGVKTPWLMRPELNDLESKMADIVVCGRVVIPSLHVSDEEEETSAKRHCGGAITELSADVVRNMTVKQLSAALRERRLAVTGSKAVLCSRLLEAL